MNTRTRLASLVLAGSFVLGMATPIASATEADVAQIGDNKYATLDLALESAIDGDTITLLTSIDIDTTVGEREGAIAIQKDITLDGGGHTITAKSGTNDKVNFINVGTANDNDPTVTIQNVKLVNEAEHGTFYHGINAYDGAEVTLNNVEISDFSATALTVNGATVTATNLTTTRSYWGGVNVGQGENVTTQPLFTLVSGNINEANGQIWVDGENHGTHWVNLPEDWSAVKAEAAQIIFTNEEVPVDELPIQLVDSGIYTTTVEMAKLAMENGETELKLRADMLDATGIKTEEDETLTLDLNGFTYAANQPLVGSTGTETNGLQLLENGTVTIKNGTLTSNSAKILLQNYADLTLEDVTVDLADNTDNLYAISNNSGSLTLKGATNIKTNGSAVAFDLYFWPNGGYGDGVTVTVDDSFTGTIEGDIEYSRDSSELETENWQDKAVLTIAGKGTFTGGFDVAENANITISGGTFAVDPTDYLAPGYVAVETDDGFVVQNATVDTAKDVLENLGELNPETDKDAINNAAGDLAALNKEDLKTDADVVTGLNDLDDLFVEANDTIIVAPTAPTVLEAEKHTLPTTEVTPQGLALAVLGGKELTDETTLSLVVNQVATAEKADFSFTAKPQKTVGGTTTEIGNHEIQSPITFRLYLPSTFTASKVKVEHLFSDSTKGSETFELTVQSDNGKRYVPITVTQFSQFNVTGVVVTTAAATYAVTVNQPENGTVTSSVNRATLNSTVTITATADKGYTVTGIQVMKHGTTPVTVTDLGNGKFTFRMPGTAVTVKAVMEADEVELPFTDVAEDDWFYGAVAAMFEAGLMEGVGDKLFAPTVTTTRAMAVQMLFNLTGKTTEGDLPFADVTADHWGYEAIAWAYEAGLVKGTGDDTFAPDDTLTRQDLVTMLYRYAQQEGGDVDLTDDFTDADEVADYAKDAMEWAVGAGIIQGYNGQLNPTGHCTRAELATVFVNYLDI